MPSLTLEGWPARRFAILLAGLGMMAAAALTIQHFFAANFGSVAGSVCDISDFVTCSSSSYSPLSQVAGVPTGYFGLMVGALVVLGACLPSPGLERTNAALAALNGIGVLALAVYSLLVLRTLCPWCAAYWLCSFASLFLFWRYGAGLLRPSPTHLAAFTVVVLAGAFGIQRFHAAKLETQVARFLALPVVHEPSMLSPWWSVRSTARFEDAPIRMVEYGDFLCSDCLLLYRQLARLKEEFRGRLNVAVQFFPLDQTCNAQARRTLHPHACEVTYVAARDTARFAGIHDEIYDNFWLAKRDSAWRAALARRYGAESALTDTALQASVGRIIATGLEYAPTSPTDPRGIHATPTIILNGRMVIGTMPYEQLHAIFHALADSGGAGQGFIERWMP